MYATCVTGGSKVVGYVRVSTAEQGDSGLGLEAQRSAIRAECDRRGWILVAVLEDAGASGKTLSGRPALAAALEMVSSGEAAGIVVAKLDRLSRSLIDFAHLKDRARDENWNLVALDLGIDLSTINGRFMAGQMAVAAEWEREIISQRTKDALAVKRSQGVRLGRPPSTDAALERRVHRLRAKGHSLKAIADRFNRERVPTLRGGSEWRPSTIHRVVRRIEASIPTSTGTAS